MMGTTEHMVMVLFTLKKIILKSLLKVEAHAPWRTQDFRGGQPQRWWRQPIILANFARKLHGNEKKMDGAGGSRPCRSLGSANEGQ